MRSRICDSTVWYGCRRPRKCQLLLFIQLVGHFIYLFYMFLIINTYFTLFFFILCSIHPLVGKREKFLSFVILFCIFTDLRESNRERVKHQHQRETSINCLLNTPIGDWTHNLFVHRTILQQPALHSQGNNFFFFKPLY